jgi:hypothetical protein
MGSAIPFVGWAATGLKAWNNSYKFRNIKNIVEKLKKNDSCPLSGNSFVPGTRVLLAGRRTKEIEKVHVGDAVVATDPAKNRTAVKAVTATVGSIAVKRIVDVAIDEDGDDATKPAIISATAEHPFWVPALRAWVPAKSLGAGFSVQTLAGRPAEITKVSERTEAARAHNFTVAEIHTYYVMANNTPVLVHNACSRTSGNNVAARNGTAIHGDFSNFLNALGNGYTGARTLGNGWRIDGALRISANQEVPIELKPNNYSQIRRGWQRLADYEAEMGAPAGSGQLWVYDVLPGGRIAFKRVL